MESQVAGKIRYEWVDVLRALAITFVVYGHSAAGFTDYFVFTSPVKMPMFFILSGYLFKTRDFNTMRYLGNVWVKLVIPWILLSAIYIMPTVAKLIINQEYIGIIQAIVEVLVGKKLWFMPCFIIGSIVHFLLLKYVKYKTVGFVLSFFFFYIGLLMKQYGIGEMFMLSRAIHVQVFFYLGYLLKDRISLLTEIRLEILLFGLLLYLAGCVCTLYFYPNECLDVHMCRYYNMWICFALIVLGNLLLISFISKISVFPKWITFIGRNSLVIYILQSIGFYVASILINIFNVDISTVPISLFAIYKTFITFIVCSVLAIIINKYAPFITGNRK